MNVYAIFDDMTYEKIEYKFLKPCSKSERIEILFLGNVPSNIKESADKSIKETYVLLVERLKSLNGKISIWFRGFGRTIQGNSMDVALAIGFISHLIKIKYIRNFANIKNVYANMCL